MDIVGIATVAGAFAAVASILFAIWRHMRSRGRDAPADSTTRKVRSLPPVIMATGRRPFIEEVERRADHIALIVGIGIREVRILEGDPGRNRLFRYIDTVKSGLADRVTIWTDTADLPDDFWRSLPTYATRLAALETEYVASKFFARVLAVAVGSDSLGLAMMQLKKPLHTLIESITTRFHFTVLIARAAEGSPAIIEFLRGNFDMNVTSGHVGRYIPLRVLSSVCPGSTIKVQSPNLLERLDHPIDEALKQIQGANIERDLLPQAEGMGQLLRAGHVVLVALGALNIKISD